MQCGVLFAAVFCLYHSYSSVHALHMHGRQKVLRQNAVAVRDMYRNGNEQQSNSYTAEKERGNKEESTGEVETWVQFVSSIPIDGDVHIPFMFRNKPASNSFLNENNVPFERPLGSLRKPVGVEQSSMAQTHHGHTHTHTHHGQQDPWGGASWTPATQSTSGQTPSWGSPTGSNMAPSWTPQTTPTGGFNTNTNNPSPPTSSTSTSSTPSNSATGAGSGSSAYNVPLTGSEGQVVANNEGAFTKALVLIQNSRRTSVGLSALQWDQSLSDNMLAYLKGGPNCGGGLQHSDLGTLRRLVGGRFKNVGENLWKGTYEPNAQLVSDDFYNEMYCFRYGRIDGSASTCNRYCNSKCTQMSPRAGCQVFHFTQYMWDTITHVGCASYLCGNTGIRLVGCQFGNINGGSGGNMMGSLPFSGDVARRLGFSAQSCN